MVELAKATELSIVAFIGPLSSHGADVVLESDADLMVVQLTTLDEVLCEGLAGMIEPGDSVLIKGSRSQALERVVESVRSIADTKVSSDPQSV